MGCVWAAQITGEADTFGPPELNEPFVCLTNEELATLRNALARD